ncbi:hypothetical protein NR402_00810 [Acidithiobacillus ferrooxidans]|jgi:ZIP family zinc transporter|uniref:hypothetical protein n=1 Tax=Acidithiobacillus ferrooxidans TaxID=920 RepID=UPI000A532D43|nr:hypothetical protein [Acidithiobacillus ferrooxidans]MCR2828830.1 hypothetical protein [Acidithiobacillus ferrooxidans]
MFTNTAFISVLMAVAEIIGAVTFVMTRDTAKRIVLSCFGLGFGLAIVLFDIIPDATTDNPSGWLLLAVGVALGALLMFKAGARGSRTGSLAAVGGMALHNLSEGIMVAAMGPAAGPIVLVGAVVHKLPEGMVALSLMRDFPSRVKATGTLLLAGIIPLGAVITIPERIQQPLLAIAAGVLFLVLSKALVLVVSGGTHRTATAGTPAGAKVAGATIAGMVFAGLSCLMMG